MDCAICREKHNCCLKIGGCNHFFCSTCIFKWYENKHTCPLCRNVFHLDDLSVVFRKGVKTRRAKRIIEEENFVLELANLTYQLKIYHFYRRPIESSNILKLMIDKCLSNIDLFHNSKTNAISVVKQKLMNYDTKYNRYILENKNKYTLLMEKITGRRWYWNWENSIVSV